MITTPRDRGAGGPNMEATRLNCGVGADSFVEMECRLQYMEAQVEEAQSACAAAPSRRRFLELFPPFFPTGHLQVAQAAVWSFALDAAPDAANLDPT